MKESITKFDLEAAFRALDDIDIPVARPGIKANRPALTEIFSRKSKFDALMEEYYDISNMTELDDAKDAREAEVAQAKLARIEKIVDLDAESPEDLLPSYVGKFIMQCPQCMTLFYKNPEDVEASEEDPATVNVNEVCQHCGNESGYTLIGKVGEATEEEQAEMNEVQVVDVDSTEDGDEIPAEDTSEETNDEAPSDGLEDFDLDELDLEIEDDETESDEKKEESYFSAHADTVLTEELLEDADLDVSADEFEDLINSPEFKKPISDNAARAMMDEFDEKDDKKKEITESKLTEIALPGERGIFDYIYDLFDSRKFVYSRIFGTPPTIKKLSDDTYKLTHVKGGASVIVKFDTSVDDLTLKFTVDGKPFTTKYIGEAQDFILKELDTAYIKQFDVDLDECIPTQLAESAEVADLEEGVFDKLKDKFANTVDQIASKLKSREAKADWILTNALEDYNNVKANAQGQLVPDETNQRFRTFVVVGFTDKYSNGKTITMAPSFNNKDLEIGKNGIQEKKHYKDADSIAKGWSMTQGNGPAFIYLAKDRNDKNAVFMCEYFKGELENDQLEKYFKVVKDHLKGVKLMAKGGMSGAENAADEVDTDTVEAGGYEGKYLRDSFESIMSGVEELQESSLEKLISDSLIEAYGNVAGFRLNECACIADKLTIDGTIYFTSGNTRKTTYAFTEAFVDENNKINFHGLNEKLGANKTFTITGSTERNTFITESFKCSKK